MILIIGLGCSKDDEDLTDHVTLADFEGSWIATSHVHTNNANASETFDMIANGGEIRFTALSGGRVRTWVTFDTFSDEWDALVTISGNKLTSRPAESTRPTVTYTFVMSENRLEMTNTDDSFDFTLSGAPEVATTAVSVFVRH